MVTLLSLILFYNQPSLAKNNSFLRDNYSAIVVNAKDLLDNCPCSKLDNLKEVSTNTLQIETILKSLADSEDNDEVDDEASN